LVEGERLEAAEARKRGLDGDAAGGQGGGGAGGETGGGEQAVLGFGNEAVEAKTGGELGRGGLAVGAG
jgi:hypothetical protein